MLIRIFSDFILFSIWRPMAPSWLNFVKTLHATTVSAISFPLICASLLLLDLTDLRVHKWNIRDINKELISKSKPFSFLYLFSTWGQFNFPDGSKKNGKWTLWERRLKNFKQKKKNFLLCLNHKIIINNYYWVSWYKGKVSFLFLKRKSEITGEVSVCKFSSEISVNSFNMVFIDGRRSGFILKQLQKKNNKKSKKIFFYRFIIW